MDSRISEIVGFLCAEGSHNLSFSSYYEKTKNGFRWRQNKRQERITFYNKDTNLMRHFQKVLSQAYNHPFRITKDNRINIAKKTIVRNLLSYTDFGYFKWKVPQQIKDSSLPVKIAFIRGYFDGDGTAKSSIRFFSVNKPSLKEVSNLLKYLGYKHTFLGPYFKHGKLPSYVIQVSRSQKKMFLKQVKPLSKKPGPTRG